MVSSGAVSGDAGKFDGHMDKCSTTFQGLSSSWKGPSNEGLTKSVNSFVTEAKIIKEQLDLLSHVCAKYEEYKGYVDQWNTLEAEIQTLANTKADTDAELASLQQQINHKRTEQGTLEERMRQVNREAVSNLNRISGTLADVDIGNTDFIPAASVAA